jgi:hypothetical protein
VVDGTVQGNLGASASSTPRWTKLVSGLPYGSHTVQILRTAQAAQSIVLTHIAVYQPKTPALPSGATQIGSYNVLTSFAATTSGNFNISSGTLRKFPTREFAYTGTWTANFNVSEFGQQLQGPAAAGSWQYTFFGTGFDMRTSSSAAVTWQFTLTDNAHPSGTNNFTTAGATTGFYGSNISSFTATTGTVVYTASAAGNGVWVSGLPLGWHTIKFAYVSGAGVANLNSLDIITPIYSIKSNLYADLQSSLAVGSNAISDDRKITPIKDALPAVKAWAQAYGITSGPTIVGVTSLTPMPDMSVTIRTSGGPLKISYSVNVNNNTATANVQTQVFVDGTAVGSLRTSGSAVGSQSTMISDSFKIAASAGTHKIDVYWAVSSNTGTAIGTSRILLVEET